uniref:Uncharacterized protein n=1 Tax=Rangifer tarandus platyrhynchus TaxID=3082113 RepID=A0ACB0F3P0_RANTA|nr:unnamed protein product [Rangifer tarandus platyrhynchus]
MSTSVLKALGWENRSGGWRSLRPSGRRAAFLIRTLLSLRRYTSQSRCKPRTLWPAERPLQPHLELGSLSPRWALDPRHGPPLHGPPSRETPAVLTSLRRVPPRLRVLAQAGAASPTALQGRSGFALLPAGVQVLRTRLYPDHHQAHTFASFLAPASPHIVALQNPPSRLAGFLASAVPRSNPERLFLTHLTVSFRPSGPSHCPLHPSAAGAAIMTNYLLTLSLPPDHCPRSFLSGNSFSLSDVCPVPSILGDLAPSHLLQAAFLDFQEGLFHCSPQATPTRPNGGLIPAQAPPIFRHGVLLSQVAAPPTCPTSPRPRSDHYLVPPLGTDVAGAGRLEPQSGSNVPGITWRYVWTRRLEEELPGGPLSGASCPEARLSWHASSEPSPRPAVFSLALTMLS